MRIGIDARQMVINERGISNYIYNLTKNLLELDKNNEWVLYVNSKDAHINDPKKIKKKLNKFSKYVNLTIRDIRSKNTFLWEQAYLPLRLLKDKIDIIHLPFNCAPFFCGPKLVSTVHDILEFEWGRQKHNYHLKTLRGKLYEWWLKKYTLFTYQVISKKSDKIIADSEKSKKDIHAELGIENKKIQVIPLGIDEDFKNTNISKKYILTLGGNALQKNLEGPIEAYSLLSSSIKNKYPLLIIGCIDKKKIKELLKKYNLNQVILKGFVSKKELVKLYNQSKIFLYLSINEGFGFPPLEAMACGTVPLVYSISPMKDNVRHPELCLPFKNNKQVASKVEELIKNNKKYNLLVSFGLRRSKDFSWENCAKKHMLVYNAEYKK
jgi:glycosyltransferase involved in cell wall biosynthesis